MIDWGEGTYEHTAETLADAAEAGADALAIAPGELVLDLGCGTGNAAIAAARRGAKVVAIDPAARLLEVTAARAASTGLAIETRAGDAGAIPSANASFDALVSIFAVIFAPDAEKAASEMVRVVKPGGRIVLTTWLPRGPIAEAGMILRAAMATLAPPDAPSAPPPPWGDEALVRALLESRGARVELATRSIVFEAASAEAWFAQQEAHHPVWRTLHRALEASPDTWSDVRDRSIAALQAGSTAKDSFRVESEYFVVKATLA